VVQPPQPAPVGVAAGAPVLGGAEEWYTPPPADLWPYSAAVISGWLKSGQLTWDTQAVRAGESNWRPLHQILEFNPSPTYGAPVGSAALAGGKDRTTAAFSGSCSAGPAPITGTWATTAWP